MTFVTNLSSNQLYSHIRAVHESKLFECDICEKRLKDAQLGKDHFYKEHDRLTCCDIERHK